jgi:hypothetical protein
MFDLVSELEPVAFTLFTSNDWVKFILVIIAALRLSFPLDEVHDWDDSWARKELRLDEFLTIIGGNNDLITMKTHVDTFSACRVVLRIVKDKYKRRIALTTNAVTEAVEPTVEIPCSSEIQGCPMFDHCMEPYINAWDADLDVGNMMPPPGDEQLLSEDWWTTMTTGWSYDTM